MRYLVVGIENSIGEFAPANSESKIQYDNYVIQVLNYETLANIKGFKTEKIKIKKVNFERLIKGQRPEDLYGKVIEVYYNQYGQFEKLNQIAQMELIIKGQES